MTSKLRIQIKAVALFVGLWAVTLMSCEKEVHINLAGSDPKVVVQGQIETGDVPYVILTSSLSFFSNIDLGSLEKSFIHGALVQVSEGTKTITLKEYSVDTGTSFKFYAYTVDSNNFMLGENGHTYTLTITYNGKVYSAVTKIPVPKGVDSMWFGLPEFANDKTLDSAREMYVQYTDPDTAGNYVRYFTQRENQPFYPAGNFSDEIINGKRISNIGLTAGSSDDGKEHNRDSLMYFFPDEKVTLKWCAIDKGVYDFWNSLDFAKNAVGNPFSTPINPITNLKNGALGVWAGYGFTPKTGIVKY